MTSETPDTPIKRGHLETGVDDTEVKGAEVKRVKLDDVHALVGADTRIQVSV